MFVINDRKATVDCAVLLSAAPEALDLLARVSGAQPGSATGTRFNPGTPGSLPSLISTARECVALGSFKGAGPLGLLYVGGADARIARERAEVARGMVPGA